MSIKQLETTAIAALYNVRKAIEAEQYDYAIQMCNEKIGRIRTMCEQNSESIDIFGSVIEPKKLDVEIF